MKQIDNVNTRLADDLRKEIKTGSKLSIAAATFSIYAFNALRKELNNISELRFLFTSPTFVSEKLTKESREFYIPNIYKESELCGGEFELRLKSELNQRAIARECAEWIRRKGTFRTSKSAEYPITGTLICDDKAYLPVNAFTTADLGITMRKGFQQPIIRLEAENSRAWLEAFDSNWKDKEKLEDVTEHVCAYFEQAYRENSPEYIYYITLYNIFRGFLKDIADGTMPDEKTGFKQTLIWNKLYNFQRDAVMGAINKLEQYKGCILADSVGLGKTFSALAVIKYYNMRNRDVLVLCPRKLEANWNTYCNNDINNPLAKDRIRYDVLFHTDLSRDKGLSNGRNLANVNWGNYGLVVIDESHNFRNANSVGERESRYQKLLRKVIAEGIETKVLMLSATPVNNRFNDLKNQLALAYEGIPGTLDEKLNTTRGIDEIFRRAQGAFNAWSRLDSKDRTVDTLQEMLDFDFFELLDSLTIARSRKHIVKYYDTTAIGRFPQRNPPVSRRPPLTPGKEVGYKSIADKLSLMKLAVYSPLAYVLASKQQEYTDRYGKKKNSVSNLTQIGREMGIQKLMSINLLKRIESSVNSFKLTVNAVLAQVDDALSKLENHAKTLIEYNFEEDIDIDFENESEESMIGHKAPVHLNDIDRVRWKEDLQYDREILLSLLDDVKDVESAGDCKLDMLRELIDEKMRNPRNPGNKKIIIFTAFADTADYLYKALNPWTSQQFGIHTALVTGRNNATTAKNIHADLNSILTCFSPRSKEKELLIPGVNENIDLLIATDCISEGQNLQDCDYLINYDIHWNPVRIVQRFGRIDRIGSINDNITMVNFWPDVELDMYINLKQRVEDKMTISVMTGAGGDNLLNTEQKELEYRKAQLKRLQNEIIDLEDVREGINITDLGLNDFRVDLSNFIRQYGKIDHIPNGLYTVTSGNEEAAKGIIFILENIHNAVNIDKQNRLHPYYLVYMKQNGEVMMNHLQAKKILDTLRLLCKGKTVPEEELCALFNRETNEGRQMDTYSHLLEKSISVILNKEEEKGIASLFKAGGTSFGVLGETKGLEDFKLISFLIVR